MAAERFGPELHGLNEFAQDRSGIRTGSGQQSGKDAFRCFRDLQVGEAAVVCQGHRIASEALTTDIPSTCLGRANHCLMITRLELAAAFIRPRLGSILVIHGGIGSLARWQQ